MKQGLATVAITWFLLQVTVGMVVFMDQFLKDKNGCDMPRTLLFRLAFPVKPAACWLVYVLEKTDK